MLIWPYVMNFCPGAIMVHFVFLISIKFSLKYFSAFFALIWPAHYREDRKWREWENGERPTKGIALLHGQWLKWAQIRTNLILSLWNYGFISTFEKLCVGGGTAFMFVNVEKIYGMLLRKVPALNMTLKLHMPTNTLLLFVKARPK